ncbi:branched-chain amino acid ABC transporter permease [Sporichthya brevicatena]|uniref:Branched-chain amino acid ABC transporter permease n=1 Tax=Sporichthya brevicatena TaxID=171442 RepID=A0ABP3RC88_9ACTN
MSEQVVNGLESGSWYALMALALVLVMRATNVPNFAMAEMGLFGAFMLWTLMDAGIPYFIAIPIALLCGALLAVVLERVLIRPLLSESEFAGVLMTIGIFVGLNALTQLFWGSQPREVDSPFTASWDVFGTRVTANQLVSLGLAIAVTYALARYFRSPGGVRMRAVAEDRVTPRLVGVSVSWVFRTAWAVAGVIATLAMVLQGQSTLLTDQNAGSMVLKGFVAATVGGFTSVWGALAAGLGLGVIENLAGYWISTSARPAVALLVVLLVLLLRPQGLFGTVRTREV